MKVSIHTKDIDEIEVEIHCKQFNDNINQLYKDIVSIDLSDTLGLPKMLPGYVGNIMSLVNTESILQFYSSNKKVYAKTNTNSYEVKLRLYEIEIMIENTRLMNFIRVSNTEIVNFDFVDNLDLNLSGRVKINFKNGDKTVISRRYTNRVMEQLGAKSIRGNL